MNVACFKFIREELQYETNWTVVMEKTGLFICYRGGVGEMERKMGAFLFDHPM